MSLEDTLYPLLSLYEALPQSLKSFIGSAYRILPATWRYGSEYTRFQHEAAMAECWDAETLSRYQVKVLRESLIAAGKAPLYARRFASFG